ncbi:hypothetical protein ACI75Y_07925 [Capnocytophaga stomatis]|uniref:DUF4835 domain-containing protein n=1 Tax=Capnocytophaga stomatis TaxID=1848904 RepID=A0A250FZN0_9FLAO|nr:hypothetical protein [Capnocytophaga stomatis]ATA90451.1 hypothetical protein CGC58_12330 [Capnocytophaga stomatis]
MNLKTKIAILALGTSFISYAQNADLDRFNVSYEYVNLPTHPINDPALRHFSITTNADVYDKSKILDNINLVGFKKREEGQDATIKIDVRIERLKVEQMDIRTEKSEKKDDKGNVIETTYTYYPYMDYVTNGSAAFTNNSGDSFNQRLGGSQRHTGESHRSYGAAQNYLKNNYEILTQNFQNKFVASIPREVQYYGNRLYGYPTYNDNILFWILGSKKNPEYQNCQKIMTKIRSMVGGLKANEPISEELKNEFNEIEKHFLDILPKYTDSKKAHRKMRYYSYYNLGRLYLIFDMPQKAIEMAEKLVQNDYDKSDGTRIKEEAEYLIKRMEINKIFTKHFPIEVVAE